MLIPITFATLFIISFPIFLEYTNYNQDSDYVNIWYDIERDDDDYIFYDNFTFPKP